MTLVPNPNPRPVFQGPTPPWVECLETWSEEHDQPRLLNGDIRILQNPETTQASFLLIAIESAIRRAE